MERKKLLFSAKIFCVVIMLIAVMSLSKTVAASELPKMIAIVSYPLGHSAYTFSAVMAEVLEKDMGVKVRVVPRDTDTGKMLSVRSKDAHLAITSAMGAYPLISGIDIYDVPEWGPQPLRVVWVGGVLCMGFATRKDSGIENWDDIKSKRYPSARFAYAPQKCQEAGLLYAGLTYNDVAEVKLSSQNLLLTGIRDQVFDCNVVPVTSSAAYELASGVHGLRWLSMDPNTQNGKKGWQRIRENAPFMGPYLVDYGAGITGAQDAKWMLGYPYAFYTYPWLDEEIAYGVTKAIWNNYDAYKDKHRELKGWTQKMALDLTFMSAPYHPGSVRFFKEINKWTDEHEQRQKELLKAQEEARKTWEAKRKK